MGLRVLVLLGAVVLGAGLSALTVSVTLAASPALAAPARTPRERVDHHVRHATELADHLETVLRKDCPRFATTQEWEAYVNAEIDRVALMMAHLEQAWVEAKTTPDDGVRRAAKAPRRRLGEARELLSKLQGCARENGSSLGTLGLWRRVEREVKSRQAEIALPQ